MIRERVEHVWGVSMVAETRVACDEPGCPAEGPLVVGSADHWNRTFAERHAAEKGCVQRFRTKAARTCTVRDYCPAHAAAHPEIHAT